MTDSLLTRLQSWYKLNCNGDWEHTFGISIETMDNPGWAVKIDLSETALDKLQFERTVSISEFDWMSIKVKDKVLEAFCDSTKLNEVLKIFLDEIIPKHVDPEFLYQVYVPLNGGPIKIWRPVNAKMLSEEFLEIVNIPELKYEDIKLKNTQEITFKREDLKTYTTEYQIGNKIKIELAQLYDGVTLIVKEN